jgi:multiple sugar transport system permease protein
MWDGITAMEFVGFENYIYVLQDPIFWQSVYNTLSIFLLTTIPQHVIAILLAFIINSGRIKMKDFFRSAYFIPYITSGVAIAMIFGMLYGKNYGILNTFIKFLNQYIPMRAMFESLGFDYPLGWLTSSKLIRPSIALLVTWKYTGWNMIIYFAGLQKIPDSLYEAAKVDGANLRQIFFNITLPLLKPIMFFAITMSIIGNLQLFAEPMVLLTQTGGPGRAGLTTAMYLYKSAFEFLDFGAGSAMAYILCLFIIILTVINNKFFQEKDKVVK